VLVDPVDVVSVPSDSNGEKMRVCRYEIIDIHDPEKEYEPVPSEAPGEDTSEAVEEKLVEAVPEDAKSYIRRMVANIRRNRRQ
jgi:hypothetical protein